MENALERKSLSVRLADLIGQAIKAGDWGKALPGHRTLMERYSVSAKTCLAAIDLLESLRLISAGEKGKRRRILAKPETRARPLTDLLMIDGQGPPSGEDLLQLQAYRTAWEEGGGRVHQVNFDFPRYRRPAALLKEAIASYRADALLLHVPPLVWVEAASALRPVFLSGGEWRGTKITGIGYNITDEIARAVEKLRGLGHQRIAVPLHPVGPKMELAVRQGVAAGLGLDADSAAVRDLCPVFAEQVPAAYQEYWKSLFARIRPTAIILQQDFHVMSLYGYCFRHGIRIPQQLSVLCLESTAHLEWCVPVPTRMRFPVRTAAVYFKKWIRGGCLPLGDGMRFISLEEADGGSLARMRH